MGPRDHDETTMHRGLRSILLEASDDELRDAFAGTGEDIDALAARGKAAADRAIAEATGVGDVLPPSVQRGHVDGEDADAVEEVAPELAVLDHRGEVPGDVNDLHRGLGALIHMLRRKERLSVDDLAQNARIAATELHSIERDPLFDPNPRTIFQLEQYFNLQDRSLVLLSGAVNVDAAVREEALRFAAHSERIQELTRDERKLINQFVKFLSEHIDR